MREPMVARIRSGHSRSRPPERPPTDPSQKAARPIPIEVTGPSPVTTTREGITRALGGSLLGGALRAPADDEPEMGAAAVAVVAEQTVVLHEGRARGDAEVEVPSDAEEESPAEPEPLGEVALVLDFAPAHAVGVGLGEGQPRTGGRIPALPTRPDLS